MSVAQWFGIGAGSAAALWWLRRCVRLVVWKWNDGHDPDHGKPALGPGLFWGPLLCLTTPLWGPVWLVIRAWDTVDFTRVLTERVFPKL